MAIEFTTIVWRLSPYRAEKLLVELAFADWANLDGEFYPTYREIAEKARITRPGAISIVQSMIEDKEIEMVERSGGGRGNRNRYKFAEKYIAAVRELSHRWAAKRSKKVKQDDHLNREKVSKDDHLKVKQDDHFSAEKVIQDAKKGHPERAHIRNNRHEPSCNTTVMQQQQSDKDLPAAAAPDFQEDHKSVFSRFTVEDYVLATKHHATNPGGLARKLWRTGEEDSAIGGWMLAKEESRRREERLKAPEPAIAADFDMDAWIDDLIANNWIPQLENEREQIEERGGPKLDWERRVVAYFNKPAANDAA